MSLQTQKKRPPVVDYAESIFSEVSNAPKKKRSKKEDDTESVAASTASSKKVIRITPNALAPLFEEGTPKDKPSPKQDTKDTPPQPAAHTTTEKMSIVENVTAKMFKHNTRALRNAADPQSLSGRTLLPSGHTLDEWARLYLIAHSLKKK